MKEICYPFIVGAMETAMEFLPVDCRDFLNREQRVQLQKIVDDKIKSIYEKEKEYSNKL